MIKVLSIMTMEKLTMIMEKRMKGTNIFDKQMIRI